MEATLRRANSAEKTEAREIFGSFFLAGNEFAVPVNCVQEVVHPPERYSSVPLAPPYLVGLFNLRGAIIPVVDLRRLLRLGEWNGSGEMKIAILELDGHCVGLQVDRTGEIFKSVEEERNDFEVEGEAGVVGGVFKRESGKRIVQILNVPALFDLKSVPKATEQMERRRSLNNRRGARKQCISFKVGMSRCALGISDIQEILKIEKVQETALATGECLGTIDLRGATVPIIDCALLLKCHSAERQADGWQEGDRRVVVLRREEELFGLLVDSVESIITYYDEDLRGFPSLGSERAKMFAGCIVMEGREETLLLDPQYILTGEEVERITRGHSKLYQNKENGANRGKGASKSVGKDGGVRRTFITFNIESTYAIPIGDVKEIIELPSKLLVPPGIPPTCRGVLNLRGEMVLIADGRRLYRVTENEPAGTPKVLVFKSEGVHFGLVVDSVEAIRSFCESDTIKLPETLYKTKKGLGEDVAEAVQYKDSAGTSVSVLILNSAAIAKRVRAIEAA